MWRKIADRRDFAYTAALKAVVGDWTPERMDEFLKDTQSFAPGADMYFTIGDSARRGAIIDYLKTLR